MADTPRDTLVTGLRNAYGMEGQGATTGARHVERLEHYPELQARLREHVGHAERHQEAIGACLERLGTSPSGFKEGVMKFAGTVQAAVHAVAGDEDEVLKNAFTDYGFVHFQIACYDSLIVMAEAADEPDVVATCRRIREDKKGLADWLGGHMGDLTRQFLSLAASDASPKR